VGLPRSLPLTRGGYSTSVEFAQEAFAQEAFAHDAELQEALDHDAELQEAELQEALDHDAELHDAEFQDAFELAVEYQSDASNSYRPVAPFHCTNWLRPALGLAVPGW
jgi:hypothetical protein